MNKLLLSLLLHKTHSLEYVKQEHALTQVYTHHSNSYNQEYNLTKSTVYNDEIYFTTDNCIYKLHNGKSELIHKANSGNIISIHATNNTIIFSMSDNSLQCLNLDTKQIQTIKLPGVGIKFVQSNEKLICLCGNGSIVCFLAMHPKTKESSIILLWHKQANTSGAAASNATIKNNLLYCFQEDNTLSILDLNSGATYKKIFFPYTHFAHVHIGKEHIYCVSDSNISTININTLYRDSLVSTAAGVSFRHAATYNDELYLASDSSVFKYNENTGKIARLYNIHQEQSFFEISPAYIHNLLITEKHIYITTDVGTVILSRKTCCDTITINQYLGHILHTSKGLYGHFSKHALSYYHKFIQL